MKIKLLVFWNIVITILLTALLFSSCTVDTSRIDELEGRVAMAERTISSIDAQVEDNTVRLENIDQLFQQMEQQAQLEEFMQLWELFQLFGW